MKLSTKKSLAFLAVAMLSTVGLSIAAAPARAAACPFPVADPASNDHPKANLRLVSPVLNDLNSVHKTALESQFSIDCDWFGVGVRFNEVYAPDNMKVTLTFQATDMAGKPLAFTKVRLRANKSYSTSNAKVRVNGSRVGVAKDMPGGDGFVSTGTTDVNGNVSFLITLDPGGCEAYGGVLPPPPASLDADSPHDLQQDDCFSQFLPEVYGEKLDSADFVEIHYFDSSALTYPTGPTSITMLTPTFTETNSIPQDGYIQTYAPIGAKQIVAFQALNADDTWARNLPVTVRINMSGSNSNAKISAGIVGNAVSGSATTLTNSGAGELTLSGTTDAFGIVTFQLNNTDTAGEVEPASRTAAVPVSGAKFSRVFAEVTGQTNTGTAVEFHYYKPIALTITNVGRKINVTVANAIGRSTSISITGKSRVTVRPTKASQVYSYVVTPGAKTITVVSGLTTVTKKITIK